MYTAGPSPFCAAVVEGALHSEQREEMLYFLTILLEAYCTVEGVA